MININNFELKYKDNFPKETIKNIKNFFEEKNLILEEKTIFQSEESNTWTCIIELLTQNEKIISTTGKGVTKDLALASGYAEMFERFCNKNYLNIHPFVNFFQLGYNYEKNNYYINKEEKIENFETINKSELIHKKYIKLLGNEKNYKQFLNYFNNNKIINIPFKNCFNSSDIIYQEPRLWEKISGSSGMAAGNTIEEALVQGISEIFEHYVQEQFFKNPPKKLYFISQTNINESNLNIMKNIEKNNNGIIKIADLSYEYSVPVCLAILYNYNTYNYIINFSAAPTIQIAIERALTELYQNKYNYKTFDI